MRPKPIREDIAALEAQPTTPAPAASDELGHPRIEFAWRRTTRVSGPAQQLVSGSQEYVRADLVAAKDARIEAAAEMERKDARIAELEILASRSELSAGGESSRLEPTVSSIARHPC